MIHRARRGLALVVLAGWALACDEADGGRAAPRDEGAAGASGSGGGAHDPGGAGGAAGHALDGPTVACDTCFAVEDLADEAQRQEAEALLLAALDGAGLHTLDGVKRPLSVIAEVPRSETARVATLRVLADVLFCTSRLSAFVHEDEAVATLVIARHEAVRTVVATRAALFAQIDAPAEGGSAAIFAAVRRASSPAREAAILALSGYPDDVVDLALAPAETPRTRLFLPTFASQTEGLGYDVPLGADAAVHEALWIAYRDLVLSYAKKRSNLLGVIGESPGALVRTFLADKNGVCSPEAAAASLEIAAHKAGHCEPLEDACAGPLDCCSLVCQPSGLCRVHTPLSLP